MTPIEVFQYWQQVPLDPSMARDGTDGTQPQFCYLPGQAPFDPINLKWESGYDNGGGVLGGMARAADNLIWVGLDCKNASYAETLFTNDF